MKKREETMKKEGRIDELFLSNRAINTLKRAHIETIEQLMSKTEKELFKIPNLGEKTRLEILKVISQQDGRKIEIDRKSKIEILNLSSKSTQKLKKLGINSINKLLKYTENELKEMEGIGPKTIEDIGKRLKLIGLELQPTSLEYPNDISRLNLSLRSYNALKRAKINTIDQLLAITDLKDLKGVGEVIAEEIKFKLAKHK